LERIKSKRDEAEKEKEDQRRKFEKKLRDKSRYSKQLTRKNKKGQPVMSAMLAHLVKKLER